MRLHIASTFLLADLNDAGQDFHDALDSEGSGIVADEIKALRD